MRNVLSAAAIVLAALAAPAIAQEAAPIAADAIQPAAGITVPPAPMTLERSGGRASALAGRTRIALAGYNIGAYTNVSTQASSGGGFTGFGARTRMDLALAGIEPALLQRIADAAHADLVAQLQAAGYDVVTAQDVLAAPGGQEALDPVESYEGEDPLGNDMLVIGPTGVGAAQFHGVGRRMIGNGNRPATASNALDAVMLYPNLSLNFAYTAGSGNRMFSNRASVEAGPGFSASSIVQVVFSREGRFADGWTTLLMDEPLAIEGEFASMEEVDSSNNNVAVALSAVLGAGLQRSQRDTYLVTADPAAYETLALSAARGFNAAIVAQVQAARS